MKDYIPKDKFDIRAVEKLNSISFETIKQDVPKLLEWLQDANWPVANPIAIYLLPHLGEIEKELLYIFNTDDLVWQYWIMHIFLLANSSYKPGAKLMSALKRIAEHPTESEIHEELNTIASELLNNYQR